MKFSILLPTRNRLELLRLAIESVQLQDHADWEIVVSDNASDEDIEAHVRALGDSRIHARRLDRLVPVTDNWNAALDLARGEYIIMLGDDDALIPGALSSMKALIDAWKAPEAIYAQARQYAYPGVIPGHAEPFIQTGYNAFLENALEPFELAPSIALDMVRAAVAFRILYGFNMQHFVFSRTLVARLRSKGAFFQSPYPDYYAANAILLAARRVVATPHPVAMIGISPKSFGFYYFNARENDGADFLQNVADAAVTARLRNEFVPGSNMNDSWLCAMQTLAQNFPETTALRVRYDRYRGLQYRELFKRRGGNGIVALIREMRWWEYLLYGAAAFAFFTAHILPVRARVRVREAIIDALFNPAPRFDTHRTVVPYRNILEAARAHVG